MAVDVFAMDSVASQWLISWNVWEKRTEWGELCL